MSNNIADLDLACAKCKKSFNENDIIALEKTIYEMGKGIIFFKQIPVLTFHLDCLANEKTHEINKPLNKITTEEDVLFFIKQKHIVEFLTKKSFHKEDNKRIMKNLKII
jgi:hypothetical protein